jgi:hypothetical protein
VPYAVLKLLRRTLFRRMCLPTAWLGTRSLIRSVAFRRHILAAFPYGERGACFGTYRPRSHHAWHFRCANTIGIARDLPLPSSSSSCVCCGSPFADVACWRFIFIFIVVRRRGGYFRNVAPCRHLTLREYRRVQGTSASSFCAVSEAWYTSTSSYQLTRLHLMPRIRAAFEYPALTVSGDLILLGRRASALECD